MDGRGRWVVLVERDGVTRRAITLELQRIFEPLRNSGYTSDDFNRERREEAEAEWEALQTWRRDRGLPPLDDE